MKTFAIIVLTIAIGIMLFFMTRNIIDIIQIIKHRKDPNWKPKKKEKHKKQKKESEVDL